MGKWVHYQVTHHARGIHLGEGRRAYGSAQHCFNMRQQNVHIEWFGDIIVSAEFQPHHFVQLAPAGGEEDHRHRKLVFELAQCVQPIHAGQPDVQQHQVCGGPACQGQGVFCSGGSVHPVAGLFQVEGQAAAQQRVVIDD